MHIPKNTDLRHVDSGLSEVEKLQAIQEGALLRQRAKLGRRWICHPDNAPKRGNYNPITGARLS